MDRRRPHNLLSGIPPSLTDESITVLANGKHTRIERIVSKGQASPPGVWYDQEWDEWVLVVSGKAGLRLEDDEEIVEMKSGDHLLIPAHCRHRVEWTSAEEETVWLAVHYCPGT